MPIHHLTGGLTYGPPLPAFMSVEIVYAVIVAVLCFWIYFKTKEHYLLTKHAGIKYFRYAFLFLGLAYLSRIAVQLIMLSGMTFDFFIPMEYMMPLFLIPMGYFSTAAILFITFHALWSKVNNFGIIAHVVAAAVSIIAFATRSSEILFILQIVVLLVAIVISYIFQKSKRFSGIRLIYVLIFVFWLMNSIMMKPRPRFPMELSMVFHLISIAVFAVILYKISKWTR
jgi:hypothetical protein